MHVVKDYHPMFDLEDDNGDNIIYICDRHRLFGGVTLSSSDNVPPYRQRDQ